MVMLSLFVFNSSVSGAGVMNELNYVNDETDVYSYVNFSKIMNFASGNGIDINDLDVLAAGNTDSETGRVIGDFGLKLSDVNEILIVMNTRDIEKKTGYLVFISLKNGKGLIPESFKKNSVKLKSGIAYKASAEDDVVFTKVNDFFVVGPAQYVDSYLGKRASKKPLLSSGSSLFIKKTAAKSISAQLNVSGYLKDTINTAMNSGAGMARGLKENVFIQTLLSLESMDWSLETGDTIIIHSGMQGSKIEDGERLLMLCHTWIVGSSFVVSFADLMAARSGDQKLAELTGDQQLMLSMQRAFGRIHARQDGKGVVISFEMTSDETDLLIAYLKREIAEEKSARAERAERDKISKLTQAIKEGRIKDVEQYIKEKYNLNSFDSDGITPLSAAVVQGDMKIVRLLADKGAGVNTPDINKLTPLHHSVKAGNKDIVAFLLSRGCNINAKDDSDMTPLHFNALQGNSEITGMLLTRGALVNAADIDGSTPLHLSASEGKIDIVKVLVERKADPELVNRDGHRAIDSAARNGQTIIVDFFKLKFKQEPEAYSSEDDYSADDSGDDSEIESDDPEFDEDVD
jgi:ankyrin repeat protein